jgi:hypothetical protein
MAIAIGDAGSPRRLLGANLVPLTARKRGRRSSMRKKSGPR